MSGNEVLPVGIYHFEPWSSFSLSHRSSCSSQGWRRRPLCWGTSKDHPTAVAGSVPHSRRAEICLSAPAFPTCCLVSITALAACLEARVRFSSPELVLKTLPCVPVQFVASCLQLFVWVSRSFTRSRFSCCVFASAVPTHMISQRATDLFFRRRRRWCYSHQHCVGADGTESRQHTLASSRWRPEDRIWWRVR